MMIYNKIKYVDLMLTIGQCKNINNGSNSKIKILWNYF